MSTTVLMDCLGVASEIIHHYHHLKNVMQGVEKPHLMKLLLKSCLLVWRVLRKPSVNNWWTSSQKACSHTKHQQGIYKIQIIVEQ